MNINESVYKLCKEYPRLREFLISKGFENLKDDLKFNTMARLIKLKDALNMKNISLEIFLEEFENTKEYLEEEVKDRKFVVKGAVPCPIKVPLLDNLNIKNDEKNWDVDFNLKSANLPMDFLYDSLLNGDYPDIITSAGYELILDEKFHNIIKNNYTSDGLEINLDFEKRGVDLKDPEKIYHIIGVVPAVFIVNKKFADKIPHSWRELLSGDYKNSVTIPVSDLDMYNAIIVSIYSKYGEKGLEKLKEIFYDSAHPAQMVKNNRSKISIAPYFFASMVASDDLEVIWPEDGAIISPIFLSIKKDKKEKLEEVVEYLQSTEISEIFSFNGKFPTTSINFKNDLDEDKKFIFADWKLLNKTGLKETIEKYFKI